MIKVMENGCGVSWGVKTQNGIVIVMHLDQEIISGVLFVILRFLT